MEEYEYDDMNMGKVRVWGCAGNWFAIAPLQRKRSRAPLDWTEHEDTVLFQHIEEHGAKKWTLVSQALQGSKTANQCRLRWHAINPERCNEPFTEEANDHILRFVDECIAANDGVRPKKMKWADLREELREYTGKCWSTLDISRQYDRLTGGNIPVGGGRTSPSSFGGQDDDSARDPVTPPGGFAHDSSPSSEDAATRSRSASPQPAAGDGAEVAMAPSAAPVAPSADAHHGGVFAVAAAADATTLSAGKGVSHESAISLDSFDWDVLDTALSYDAGPATEK